MDRVYIAGSRWQSNLAQRIVFFVGHVPTPRLVETRICFQKLIVAPINSTDTRGGFVTMLSAAIDP
jgi:hypothetical protein